MSYTAQEIETLIQKLLTQHDQETDRAGQEKRDQEQPVTEAISTARAALVEALAARRAAEALRAILPGLLAELVKKEKT